MPTSLPFLSTLAGRPDVNGYLACAVIALSLLGGASVRAGNNAEAAPPGILEAQTAFHYAQAAYEADDIIVAKTSLQKAIDCLVGQGDKRFSAASGDPCDGQGKGAIQDVKDASLGQQLQFALAEASLGLKRTGLTNVRMHALSAMSYMQSARTDDASVAGSSSSPSSHFVHPVVGFNAGAALSSQMRGAAVTGSAGGAIGTITDFAVAAQSHAVSLVGLDANGRDGTIRAVYWKDLGLSRAVAPGVGYASGLSANRLDGAPRFAEAVLARPSYIDVYDNLIGRTVLVGDGKAVGKVSDLVIDLHSGHVDFILVSASQADTGRSQSQLALQWSDIADFFSQRDIVLKLSETQFASAPRFLPR
jgi:sporulation protein YlmC with PRC-barrel domain